MGKQNMEEKSVLSVFTGKKQNKKKKKRLFVSGRKQWAENVGRDKESLTGFMIISHQSFFYSLNKYLFCAEHYSRHWECNS